MTLLESHTLPSVGRRVDTTNLDEVASKISKFVLAHGVLMLVNHHIVSPVLFHPLELEAEVVNVGDLVDVIVLIDDPVDLLNSRIDLNPIGWPLSSGAARVGGGSFGVVSRNRRSTRRFTLWYSSSPSRSILQHRHALNHWETRYCFVELLGDAPTAPFFRRLDPFLQGSAHWNKSQSKTLWRLAKWTRRSSGLHFLVIFSLFAPFCNVVSMLSFKHQIPKT
uniref:Uncharacterized protein n=1 Tax=Solanum tuberosum TaxID=4113 RepID=M1BE79_SOLTU